MPGGWTPIPPPRNRPCRLPQGFGAASASLECNGCRRIVTDEPTGARGVAWGVREAVGSPTLRRLLRDPGVRSLLKAARAAGAGAGYLRLRGVSVGRRPLLYGRMPVVGGGGTIEIGDDFRCDAPQFRASLTADRGATLRLGDAVFVNQGATIHAATSVEIGDHVLLADLVAIYDTDFHELEPGAGTRVAPVVLEDNVWLGRGAIVLPGVTVGRNAVVAAGSVVTRTVPANHLVAGNPAVPLRELHVGADWVRQPLRRASLRAGLPSRRGGRA